MNKFALWFFLALSCSFFPLHAEIDDDAKDGAKEDASTPTPHSPHTFSGYVSFLTDYRSRGISQTMLQPAVQGELKYAHENGFYFKTDGSNVDGTTHFLNNTSMEWDFFLGFTNELGVKDFTYDIGFIYYFYPGGEALVPARVRYNTIEYFIGFNYKIFNMKFYQTITDFYGQNAKNPPFNWSKNIYSSPNGHSYGSPYVEANLEWSPWKNWTTTLHIGYQAVVHYSQLNYCDWLASISYKFDWFALSLAAVGTNAKGAYYDVPNDSYKPTKKRLGGPGVVVTVRREF